MARTKVIVNDKTKAVINKLMSDVCRILELDLDKITSPETIEIKKYYEARYIIVYRIRKMFDSDVPYSYIGKQFNRNNHNFAFHAELRCRVMLRDDKEMKEKYNMVVNSLANNVNIA